MYPLVLVAKVVKKSGPIKNKNNLKLMSQLLIIMKLFKVRESFPGIL